jgi:hypothetical protein
MEGPSGLPGCDVKPPTKPTDPSVQSAAMSTSWQSWARSEFLCAGTTNAGSDFADRPRRSKTRICGLFEVSDISVIARKRAKDITFCPDFRDFLRD